jgi:aromatic ring-opening dioxygenase catalytic subunit (LigB family)
MFNFKDLGIKPKENNFIGDKINIDKVLNTEISVLDYKVEPSKVKQGTELLTLQIERKGDKYVLFTGSGNLIHMIRQVKKENFPFKTIIIKQDRRLEFT